MALFASFDKISTLIQNLLVVEAWKDHLYPILQKHIAKKVDPLISYILLFNEAAIANLLEVHEPSCCKLAAVGTNVQYIMQVMLFHATACEAIDEDHLLELCDWCYRKLHYLNTTAYKDAEAKGKRWL
jgi:zinc finger MYND domain-containing protein 10